MYFKHQSSHNYKNLVYQKRKEFHTEEQNRDIGNNIYFTITKKVQEWKSTGAKIRKRHFKTTKQPIFLHKRWLSKYLIGPSQFF